MIILMLANAFFAGFMLAWGLSNWADDKPAKLPLALAAINFAAIGVALI